MTLNLRLLWFFFSGIVGLAVDMSVLMILREPLGVYGARIASFIAAATATWLINRHLTFADRSAGIRLLHEYIHYLGLMLGGGIANFSIYSILIWRFSQTSSQLILYVCAGSLAGMTVNFLSTNQWLYRHHTNNSGKAIHNARTSR